MRRILGVIVALTCVVMLLGTVPVSASTRWRIEPTLNPGAVASTFRAVSCVSSTFCVAVGYEDATSTKSGTLIEQWDGVTWSLMQGVNPDSVSLLYGVSCLSETFCVAVGETGPFRTLVESWDGTEWTHVPSPNDGTGYSNTLQAVSCASVTACVAVGSSPGGTLSEIWDGTTWSIVPRAARLASTFLTSVSCVSAQHCVAVGLGGAHTRGIERWNGTKWTVMPGGTASLTSVSCSSVAHCVAVGGSTIDTWDGTTWTETTAPPVGDASGLNGVSCVSATRCVAVGSWGVQHPHGFTNRTLVESWDGTGWTVSKSPNPFRDNDIALVGVSCSTHHNCAAVGWAHTTPGGVTLALVSH